MEDHCIPAQSTFLKRTAAAQLSAARLFTYPLSNSPEKNTLATSVFSPIFYGFVPHFKSCNVPRELCTILAPLGATVTEITTIAEQFNNRP